MEIYEAIKHLQESMIANRIAMFTTVTDNDRLHSRPMVVQQKEFDRDLWFFTSEDSGKAAELQHNAEVNVSFSDSKENRFVSVSGTASLVHDRAKFEEFWSLGNEIYFPKGIDDPSLALVKVSVYSIAWWEGSSSLIGRVTSVVKALVKKDPSELGESGASKV